MSRFVIPLLLLVSACNSRPAREPDFGPTPASATPPPSNAAAAANAELPAATVPEAINPRLLRRFKPLRASFDDAGDPPPIARVALGRMLWFDKRLSRGGELSCNSCHQLDRYGVDHVPTSVGFHGKRGARNSPSVYQAAGNIASFWDGRAPNVEEQVKGPLFNPDEMAMESPENLVEILGSMPGYVTAFAAAFPGQAKPLTYANVALAVGAFERGLVTPARWDRYLNGDHAALTSAELHGLKLFTSLGCMTCHTGELVGGSSFQKVGVLEPWPNQTDQGRFSVTKTEADRMTFRVPSLRNVAMTAPYFHDGSVQELSTAVEMMARHQLGEDLDPEGVASIVAWLGSLTGELPRAYIAEPKLPESGPSTAALARK